MPNLTTVAGSKPPRRPASLLSRKRGGVRRPRPAGSGDRAVEVKPFPAVPREFHAPLRDIDHSARPDSPAGHAPVPEPGTLVSQLRRRAVDAGEVERRSIGRDLHDVVGSMLIGLLYRTETLQRTMAGNSTPQAEAEASCVRDLAAEIVDCTRRLAQGLVPAELESGGLISALRELSAGVRLMFRASCRLKCDPRVSTDPSVALQVYRIVQQAVVNAVRHGKARNVLIRVERHGATGRVTVQDDGSGLPELPRRRGGLGLRNMAERTALIGARVEFGRHPMGGTLVTCTGVPMGVPAGGSAGGPPEAADET